MKKIYTITLVYTEHGTGREVFETSKDEVVRTGTVNLRYYYIGNYSIFGNGTFYIGDTCKEVNETLKEQLDQMSDDEKRSRDLEGEWYLTRIGIEEDDTKDTKAEKEMEL